MAEDVRLEMVALLPPAEALCLLLVGTMDEADDLVQAACERALSRQEVGKFSDDQRSVLALVVVEGMSYQQAADMLGIKIGTIMSRLARARLKLAAALDPQTNAVEAVAEMVMSAICRSRSARRPTWR